MSTNIKTNIRMQVAGLAAGQYGCLLGSRRASKLAESVRNEQEVRPLLRVTLISCLFPNRKSGSLEDVQVHPYVQFEVPSILAAESLFERAFCILSLISSWTVLALSASDCISSTADKDSSFLRLSLSICASSMS